MQAAEGPTFLGRIGGVSGSSLHVYMAKSVASGLLVLNGITHRVGQVGSFVRIPQGYHDLYGIVTDVGAAAAPVPSETPALDSGRWLKAQLLGEALAGVFERGISEFPSVDSPVHVIVEQDLARIYGALGRARLRSADFQAQRAFLRALTSTAW